MLGTESADSVESLVEGNLIGPRQGRGNKASRHRLLIPWLPYLPRDSV